jgi:hypothetical protein
MKHTYFWFAIVTRLDDTVVATRQRRLAAWHKRSGEPVAKVAGRVDVAANAGIVHRQAKAQVPMLPPKIAQARRAACLQNVSDDRRWNEHRVAAAPLVIRNNGVRRPLIRASGKCRQGTGVNFGVIARLQDHCRGRVEPLGRMKPRVNRVNQVRIRIALDSMKRPVTECGRHSFGFVPKHNDHFITDSADRVISCGDQRLRTVIRGPGDELLGPTHATTTARSEQDTNAARC